MLQFVILLYIGGLMGLPGMGDLEDLILAVAQVFKKDYKLERKAREFIVEMSESPVLADTILRGTSRYGFGIPAALDYVGTGSGVGDVPMPTVDLSRSLGIGRVNPIELATMFGSPAQKDVEGAMSRNIENLAGAGFGIAFAMYEATQNMRLNSSDPKRWERAMPAILRQLNQTYEAYQGGITNQAGAKTTTFDPTETEHIAEMVAMGLGFQLTRRTIEMEKRGEAARETVYWDVQREVLMVQLATAVRGKDQKELQKVVDAINEFNRMLPDAAKQKSISHRQAISGLREREKARVMSEMDEATQKQNVLLRRNVNELYPDTKILDSRRIK